MKSWAKISMWVVLAGAATYILSRIIGPLFVGALFILLILIGERDHVDDEILIANLAKDLAKYELLISMFRQDSPLAVAHPTWMSPDNSISGARWREYRKLFDELELDAGMRYSMIQFIEGERHQGGESILFISTSKGLVTGGSSKGYIYKPENPHPQFESLDNIPADLESNITGYRKINEDWYITFDWND